MREPDQHHPPAALHQRVDRGGRHAPGAEQVHVEHAAARARRAARRRWPGRRCPALFTSSVERRRGARSPRATAPGTAASSVTSHAQHLVVVGVRLGRSSPATCQPRSRSSARSAVPKAPLAPVTSARRLTPPPFAAAARLRPASSSWPSSCMKRSKSTRIVGRPCSPQRRTRLAPAPLAVARASRRARAAPSSRQGGRRAAAPGARRSGSAEPVDCISPMKKRSSASRWKTRL